MLALTGFMLYNIITTSIDSGALYLPKRTWNFIIYEVYGKINLNFRKFCQNFYTCGYFT